MFSPADTEAIALSLKVASAATLVALPLGFITAYVLARKEFPGKSLVDGIIHLPLVLPPVVVGYLLLVVLGRRGVLGEWLAIVGIEIVFTWKAAVAASVVVGFPLMVRAMRAGIEAIDPRLLDASRTLGATWLDTVRSVVLPLSLRSIVVGATMMFARSLGEFGATIMVAGSIPGATRTIPLAIYEYTNTVGGDAAALKLCLVSMAMALAILVANEYLTKKIRRGA